MPGKLAPGGFADGVVRKLRDKRHRNPEFREADGDVGLPAAEARLEGRGLKQPLEAGRRKAEHELPEGNDLRHHSSIPGTYPIRFDISAAVSMTTPAVSSSRSAAMTRRSPETLTAAMILPV